jgi:hypothetical protein
MSRRRIKLTEADYQKAAGDKWLKFVGPQPESRLEPTTWCCLITGKEIVKSYAAVLNSKYGSRYQRDYGLWLSRYHALAKRLGIEFIYNHKTDYFPADTKVLCKWRSRGGIVVEATYHSLAYGYISHTLCDQLGLIFEEVNSGESKQPA